MELSERQKTILVRWAVIAFSLLFWTAVVSCVATSYSKVKEARANRARVVMVQAQTIQRVCTDLQDYGLELSTEDCIRLFNEIR